MFDKKSFIQFMLDCKVLQFGEFKTKSGRLSPYFINTGNYNSGQKLDKLGEYYADIIELHFGAEVTNIFGPAYKGIPIATSTATAMSRKYSRDLTVTFNRKEVKDHGEGGWLLGFDYKMASEPQKVVIVEDVTTAGTSIYENLPQIIAYENVEVVGLVVSVDRMEQGPQGKGALTELAEKFGIKTVSLINFNELVDYLKSSELSEKESLLAGMERYRQQYGAS